MDGICIVGKAGNSASVVLPAEWRRRHGVSVGDKLKFTTAGDAITFTKGDGVAKVAAVEELLEKVSQVPVVPWLDGDSPEDDKRVLRERAYE